VDIESGQVGVAGEYLAAGELSLRGIVSSVTLRNSRGIDIICSNPDATKSLTVQVKTSSSDKEKWIVTKKSEDFYSDNHFYIFVRIISLTERPGYHIVPSKIVAETIRTGHKNWLNGKKKDGSARKDSSIRNFTDPDHLFQDKWEIILDALDMQNEDK
jgi:hypothetical protein